MCPRLLQECSVNLSLNFPTNPPWATESHRLPCMAEPMCLVQGHQKGTGVPPCSDQHREGSSGPARCSVLLAVPAALPLPHPELRLLLLPGCPPVCHGRFQTQLPNSPSLLSLYPPSLPSFFPSFCKYLLRTYLWCVRHCGGCEDLRLSPVITVLRVERCGPAGSPGTAWQAVCPRSCRSGGVLGMEFHAACLLRLALGLL